MKKAILFIVVVLTIMEGLPVEAQKQATFTGKIENYTGKDVTIMEALNPTGEMIPVELKSDGSFTFTVNADKPDVYYFIIIDPKSGFKFFVRKGMKANFDIHFADSLVMGQKVTMAKVAYNGKSKDVFDFLGKISFFDAQNKTLMKIQNNPMSFKAFRDDFRHNLDSLEAVMGKLSDKVFIKMQEEDYEQKFNNALVWWTEFSKESDSDFDTWANTLNRNDKIQASIYAEAWKKFYAPKEGDASINYFKALNNLFPKQEIADELADKEITNILQQAPANIGEVYAAYKAVNPSRQIPENIKQSYNHYKSMTIGKQAKDFDMYTADDKKVMLSDLKGKYVYIDCWATWCGPCKMEAPHMAKLYEHYKDNPDIVLVSVSVDEKEDAWKKMIGSQKPAWPQYIVKGAFKSSLCTGYDINAIPRFMMFDKQGNVVSLDAPRPSNENIITWIDNNIKD